MARGSVASDLGGLLSSSAVCWARLGGDLPRAPGGQGLGWGPMATGTVYLDVDDEITSAAARIRGSEATKVALVETISDATNLLVDQQDVTPLGLAFQAIELQTTEDPLDAALRRVLRAMKV